MRDVSTVREGVTPRPLTKGSMAWRFLPYEVAVLIVFSFVGYLMKKFDIPVIPFTIALVLGNLCETNLRRALMVSYGDPMILVRRPICFGILLFSVLLLLYPWLSRTLKKAHTQ